MKEKDTQFIIKASQFVKAQRDAFYCGYLAALKGGTVEHSDIEAAFREWFTQGEFQ